MIILKQHQLQFKLIGLDFTEEMTDIWFKRYGYFSIFIICILLEPQVHIYQVAVFRKTCFRPNFLQIMYLYTYYNDVQKFTNVVIQLTFEVQTIIKMILIVRHRKVITTLLQTIQADCDASKN